MRLDGETQFLSRREVLRRAGLSLGVALGILSLPVLGTALVRYNGGWCKYRWYEVVQDREDGDKWHVNLFAAPRLGDLEQGEHLGYRVMDSGELERWRQNLLYPARFHFRDGHKEGFQSS